MIINTFSLHDKVIPIIMENEPTAEEAVIPQEEPIVEETVDEVPEDTTDWKAEALKAQAIAQRYKTKLEKKQEPVVPQANVVPKEQGLNTDDLYALMEAKVPKEDVKEVREYAQFKGISIEEALKSTAIRSILSDNAEKRKSAEVANVSPTRKNKAISTPEDVLAAAKSGKLPDDPDVLVAARFKEKKERK